MKDYILFLCILVFVTLANGQDMTKSTGSLSMAAPTISVTVGGDFIINGTFPAFISERVDAFVTRMYNQARETALRNITDSKLLQVINKKLDEYSLRNITLKRSDGQVLHIDLMKFRLTGDFANDPYLRNDDVLIFSPVDFERDFFKVEGAVNNPGKFPFVDGDRLSDAMELAQGVNKAYENVTQAAIYRLSYNGEKMDKMIVDINSETPLERGDRIVVLADETQKKSFSVLILGEVKSPGQVPITKENTTIRKAIEDAGGFTSLAWLNRAKLIRGTNLRFVLEDELGLNLDQQSRFLSDFPNPLTFDYEKAKMLRMTTLTEMDTGYFSIDELVRQTLNETTVNFDSVMEPNSSIGNMKLKDGDIIYIPQKSTTVYVYGQVRETGNFQYEEGKDFSYYINKAGGYGDLADKGSVSVIKGNSREWLKAEDDNKINPGDFIYVPKNPNHAFDYYLGRVATYFGIVGSIATIILLLRQF